MRPIVPELFSKLVCPATNEETALPDVRVVGLYISAWGSPQCCEALELLISYYEEVQKEHPFTFEIIFISDDVTEQECLQHANSMLWPMLNYDEMELKERLLTLYRVSRIPFLVFLDKDTGKVIDSGMVPQILTNTTMPLKLPYRARSLQAILSTAKIVDCDDNPLDCEDIMQGYLLLFFGSNWCPPCKSIKSNLKLFYEQMKLKSDIKFEALFISFDRSENSYRQMRQSMTWPSLALEDSASRQELVTFLEISGLPSVILINSDYDVVHSNFRVHLEDEALKNIDVENFPWELDTVSTLHKSHSKILSRHPSLVLFADDEEDRLKCLQMMAPIAEEYYSRHPKGSSSSLLFFVAADDEMSSDFREWIEAEYLIPQMVLVDFPQKVRFDNHANHLNKQTIKRFLERYLNNDLDATIFSGPQITEPDPDQEDIAIECEV